MRALPSEVKVNLAMAVLMVSIAGIRKPGPSTNRTTQHRSPHLYVSLPSATSNTMTTTDSQHTPTQTPPAIILPTPSWDIPWVPNSSPRPRSVSTSTTYTSSSQTTTSDILPNNSIHRIYPASQPIQRIISLRENHLVPYSPRRLRSSHSINPLRSLQ